MKTLASNKCMNRLAQQQGGGGGSHLVSLPTLRAPPERILLHFLKFSSVCVIRVCLLLRCIICMLLLVLVVVVAFEFKFMTRMAQMKQKARPRVGSNHQPFG